MVIWIIGLSGLLTNDILFKKNFIVEKARKDKKKVVLIDGDIFRDVFENDLG